MNRDRIREVFLAHGFTIKDGQTDLKPYVYEAAEALLAAMAERDAARMGYVDACKALSNAWAERDAAREEAAGWQAQMARDLDKLLAVAAERDALRREVEARKPLTEEPILDEMVRLLDADQFDAHVASFIKGVRFAERTHWMLLPAPPSADGGAT